MLRYFSILTFSFLFLLNTYAKDSALSVLADNGFSTRDLADIADLEPTLVDLKVSTQVVGFKSSTLHFLKVYAEKTNDAFLISKVGEDLTVERFRVRVFEGPIYRNLHDSVLKETKNKELAEVLDHAFKDELVTTKGLRAKARFQFEVEEVYDENTFIRFGNIVRATLFIGEALSTKIYSEKKETGEWGLFPEHFDLMDKPFYSPVLTNRVTSGFNLKRRHPVTKRYKPHKGIDFGAPAGTPIYPAMEGEVIAVARTKSKGKFVTLRHDNGYETTYIHLKKHAPAAKVGTWVSLEDQIGEVGRTGYSTGAHLHFGVLYEGFYVNPIYLMKGYAYKNKDQFETLDLNEESPHEVFDEEMED